MIAAAPDFFNPSDPWSFFGPIWFMFWPTAAIVWGIVRSKRSRK